VIIILGDSSARTLRSYVDTVFVVECFICIKSVFDCLGDGKMLSSVCLYTCVFTSRSIPYACAHALLYDADREMSVLQVTTCWET